MLIKHANERIREETIKQQEKRKKIVGERVGKPKDLSGLSDGRFRDMLPKCSE